ncbi:hypothetical protein, partial [Bacteroides heparinolyticus]
SDQWRLSEVLRTDVRKEVVFFLGRIEKKKCADVSTETPALSLWRHCLFHYGDVASLTMMTLPPSL